MSSFTDEKIDLRRRTQPVMFAALEAMGKRGSLEIQDLWPAVDRLAAELECPPDVITLAAFIGAARVHVPDVGGAVALVARQFDAARLFGRPWPAPENLHPRARADFEELHAVGTAAAVAAANALEPA